MPIKVPEKLPAVDILKKENIFVMTEKRALHQDIRALKIAILNLMPTKIVTETQILRLLGNSPIQVDIVLLHPETYKSKNTDPEHLANFYKTFSNIKKEKFDGLIITGAPVETFSYEEVDYWDELKTIMEWSKSNVFSTFHICWGAQAGLFYHYNIPKYSLKNKIFGVFKHHINNPKVKLMQGFDDRFYVPHSRHTKIRRKDVEKAEELLVLSESEKAGVYLIISKDGRQIFATGHSEYDAETLKHEYLRDRKKGIEIELPENYFPENNHENTPVVRWRSHANLLFSNWLNYYVYQQTPYELENIH